MRLLFDQNLAPRLPYDLADAYPGSSHVRQAGLERADDGAVRGFARSGGFTIVTKDDFRQRSFVYGAPPEVVRVRLGNCTTASIEALLRARFDDVARFEADPTAALRVLARIEPLPAEGKR